MLKRCAGALAKAAVMAAVSLLLSGCAAVLVGGLIYDHTRNREEKKQFTEDFRKQNLEREKAGLKPLDWCQELYKFDQHWYGEDANCRAEAEKSRAAGVAS